MCLNVTPAFPCTPHPAAWRAVLAQRQLENCNLEVAVQRWMQVTLAAAFSTWREGVAEQQGHRRALARFTHSTLSKAWASWAAYVHESLAQRQKLQHAVDWWLHGVLTAAFAQVWVEG